MHAFASLLLCTPVPASTTPAPVEGEIVVLLYAGAEELLVDAKDQGLLAALNLLDERLAELPGEVPDFPPIPPEVMPLAARLCTGPVGCRVRAASAEGPLPVSVQLALPEASADAARSIATALEGLLRTAGVPLAAGESGMRAIEGPVAARFGASGTTFVVEVGEPQPGAMQVGETGLPQGIAPVIALSFDYGAFFEMIEKLAPDEEDLDELEKMLETLGIDELHIDYAMGLDAERTHEAMRMPGYARAMRESGVMPTSPLSPKALAAVPSDAVWASLGSSNVQATVDLLLDLMDDHLARSGLDQDPIEMLAEATGVHLERDVLDHLGSTSGIYASDTTGGGGLASMVAFFELSNPQAMSETCASLEEMLNGLAQQFAQGYVQVRRWELEGTSYSTLTFPGLPVPFEPTFAIAGGFLFAAASPQAAWAAVAQVQYGTQNLGDHAGFREQAGESLEGLYGIQFLDAPRLLDDGYGLMGLACSALANGTRSRQDAARDAGMVLPPYHALAKGAKPWVALSRIDGDDWVMEMRSDRSMLVNLTATLGFLADGPLLPLIALAGLPAALLGERMEAAAPSFDYEFEGEEHAGEGEHEHGEGDHDEDGGD